MTATKPPIQAKRGPMSVVKAPTTPRRLCRPIANSVTSRGIDQTNRKITQGMRKAAPPFCATMRGKRHMFPVPTAIPRPARIRPQREVKLSCLFIVPSPVFAGVAARLYHTPGATRRARL